ncbi:hypothetical protein AbraIFM66951_002454 [Aspergillus brasiliensis]|uniref:AAA+ ATPase domain-containing protein n=1 Tax=Aspergillus brasiliensis TaxID=319629 RepID=A0A9W5Z0N1_9EURO|nr:hypothetical protein AbraCBS73388_001748 [Aspergillus brasiliensis]GKZ49749.1 hypothetical protein AbraIFM66951_002454 [Aspergillus brasiliensis]
MSLPPQPSPTFLRNPSLGFVRPRPQASSSEGPAAITYPCVGLARPRFSVWDPLFETLSTGAVRSTDGERYTQRSDSSTEVGQTLEEGSEIYDGEGRSDISSGYEYGEEGEEESDARSYDYHRAGNYEGEGDDSEGEERPGDSALNPIRPPAPEVEEPPESVDIWLGIDNLNSNPLTLWKHTTISEDRTAESGWSQRQLAGVLPQVARPDLDQRRSPIRQPATTQSTEQGTEQSAFSFDFSPLENPDILEGFNFDTFPNADTNIAGFLWASNFSTPAGNMALGNPQLLPRSTRGGSRIITQASGTSQRERHGTLSEDTPANGLASDADSEDDSSHTTIVQSPSENDGLNGYRHVVPRELERTETGHIEFNSHYKQLLDRVRALEQENALLKSWIDPDSAHGGRPFCQIVYRFKRDDRVFFKPPVWFRDDGNRYSLRGSSLAMKSAHFLQQSSNLAFVIYKTYNYETVDGPAKVTGKEPELPPLPEPDTEAVLFASKEMRSAMQAFLESQPNFRHLFPYFDISKEIPSPYLFWYCFRPASGLTLRSIPSFQRDLIKLFADWVNANYGAEYEHTDSQVARGVISCQSMKYLIRPGDPLVFQGRGLPQAYQATSWVSPKPTYKFDATEDDQFVKSWEVSVWSYEFDGAFHQKPTILDIKLEVTKPDEEVALSSLEVTPLDYARPELREKLERRGNTFWACRKKKFISYSGGDDIDSLNNNSERFMIDFPTYRQLHPESKPPPTTTRTEIPRERMDNDEPPTAPEIFLFPPRIVGFNLRRKKWVNLEVDEVNEVEWNKKAFENLVIDEKTKELVQALVTNRLKAEQGTDMIDDKGNGLTILLHGGPGTGKTFTAESVAELAEKPLYRVTCGDIGTLPENVEHYLESALHLGKIWDCIVLLDEADVFLQERTLSDLQRNALVTVFLRILEYYDGILILTSNRVGTFDEAFKSRIQISLHYPNLTRSQRFKIWRNLINRLKRLQDPDIDFDDVECYIGELADQEMNGREIRNAITTSRQLAKFKGKSMSYADLQQVLDVSRRFDKYLFSVKEGLTDDDIARDSGIR